MSPTAATPAAIQPGDGDDFVAAGEERLLDGGFDPGESVVGGGESELATDADAVGTGEGAAALAEELLLAEPPPGAAGAAPAGLPGVLRAGVGAGGGCDVDGVGLAGGRGHTPVAGGGGLDPSP